MNRDRFEFVTKSASGACISCRSRRLAPSGPNRSAAVVPYRWPKALPYAVARWRWLCSLELAAAHGEVNASPSEPLPQILAEAERIHEMLQDWRNWPATTTTGTGKNWSTSSRKKPKS